VSHAIRKHLGDFLAILALVVIALAVGAYILHNQRLRFPVVEDKPVLLKAELPNSQAVTPGQGQTVRVAGVKVGDIGKTELEDGRAVVTMEVDRKYKDLIHQGATALLRPKTGLKDMFLEVEPGNKQAPVLTEKDRIPVVNTASDVDQDEIFEALDADTRDYLKLLINGAGKGLKGRANDLKETFRRLGPIHRDLARVTEKVAERRRNLARLVHNYSELTNELADKDQELTRLVDASNAVFQAFASQDQNISSAVSKLPGALDTTGDTLIKVDRLGRVLGPSLDALRPAIRKLDDANRASRPFLREAEPILRKEIRPFVKVATPYVKNNLRPAARNLSEATPDLTEVFFELNRLFNLVGFNKGGRESLPSNPLAARARDEGYLFWVGWVAQLTDSLFSTADATGPFRRALIGFDCSTIEQAGAHDPSDTASLILGTSITQLQGIGLCPGTAP
jgi:phospholipid/cholesterol/gamma-HCH transport system substrate-binding protein